MERMMKKINHLAAAILLALGSHSALADESCEVAYYYAPEGLLDLPKVDVLGRAYRANLTHPASGDTRTYELPAESIADLGATPVDDAGQPVCMPAFDGHMLTIPKLSMGALNATGEPATVYYHSQMSFQNGMFVENERRLLTDASAPAAQDSNSSLLNPQARYADRSCPLEKHITYKTALDADCRCGENSSVSIGLDVCMRPYEVARNGKQVAEGPSFALYHNAHISGGFIDYERNELIASVYWDNSADSKGLVVAYNLDDWSRRFISGTAQNDMGNYTIAEGPEFHLLKDIQPGGDGNWYAFSYVYRDNSDEISSGPVIYKVNPEDGNRTTVWEGRNGNYGQCPSGRINPSLESQQYVQYTQEVFAVDPADNSFIVSFNNSLLGGTGFARIAPDGSSCDFISLSGQRDDGLAIGAGFDMRGPMLGAYLHDGKIYTHSTLEKTMFEIDPATGDRKAIIRDAPKPQAWRHIQWDEQRQVFWISGKMNSAMVTAYDPALNQILVTDTSCTDRDPWDWFPLCKEGPLATLTLNYGPMWLNKNTGTLLFGYDAVGIVEFEPESGNSMNRSL